MLIGLCPSAYADDGEREVQVLCSPKAGTAILRGYFQYDDQPEREGSVFVVHDLPSGPGDYRRPRLICDFGHGQTLSLESNLTKDDYDQGDNIDLYWNQIPVGAAVSFFPYYRSDGDDVNYFTVKFQILDHGRAEICESDHCEILTQGKTSPESPGLTPSFDCAKASVPVDILICKDPWMPTYDRRLAEAFHTWLNQTSDPAALRREQRTWRKDRAHHCAIPETQPLPPQFHAEAALDCLADLYDSRVDELHTRSATWIAKKGLSEIFPGIFSGLCNAAGGYEFEISNNFLDLFIDYRNAYTLYDVILDDNNEITMKLFAEYDKYETGTAKFKRIGNQIRLWSVDVIKEYSSINGGQMPDVDHHNKMGDTIAASICLSPIR